MSASRRRIGPKMAAAVSLVESAGGYATLYDIAAQVNPCPRPEQNQAYGYNVIDRCIAAGILVRDIPLAGRRGMSVRLPNTAPVPDSGQV